MVADTHDQTRDRRRAADPPPQAVMGLLGYITATSLDEDYAHVSSRRGPGSGPAQRRPGTTALLALAVFGLLVATAAVQTARTADESASSRSSLIKQVVDGKHQLAQRRASLRALQREVSTLQSRERAASSQGARAQQALTTLGLDAGSAVARGPGIQVVVDDAPGATSYKQQVQSPDLQKLVNGLWLVGAEAISINGQRLTSLSSIRDAASSVTVNYVSLRAPYTISAIGNEKTMGARLLDTAGGEALVTLQSTFGLTFDITPEDSMVLPAAKRVTLRSAREPAPKKGASR